jgi:ATP-dependent Clp protease ATP-binding subunit ClpB
MDNFLKTGSETLKANPGFKLVGRAEDLRRLGSVLMRSKAASVLLVGAGGVGITSLCLGLQASKDTDNVAFDIVNKRIFWLDYDGLFASGNSDAMNKAWQTILGILKRTKDSILIIEDTRDFIEGSRNNGVSHFINSLNSCVKNGDTQVILEAKDDDLEFVLKSHSDMRECYTMLSLEEPLSNALLEIVTGTATVLEEHHGIKIDPSAVAISIDLTTKYRTRDLSLSRAQPERSVNLLDRALSSYRLEAHQRNPDAIALEKIPGHSKEEVARLDSEFAESQSKMKTLFRQARDAELAIIDIESQIDKQKELEEERRKKGETIEKEDVISSFGRLASASGNESKEVRELRSRLASLDNAAKKNHEEFAALAAVINAKLLLTDDLVMLEFSRISGIPVNKLNEDEREKLLTLEDNISKRIFGQDDAVRRIANAIKIAKIGRRNGVKPEASFMLYGPSGTGKTEIAKTLAQLLLGDEGALTRYDMSEYMEKHAVARLIGAPPGYEGFDVGGILTNDMRKNPVRVLLFDEIEKAHPDVFNVFLQILSDGRLTDNVGRVVDFRRSIIIMTTNLTKEGVESTYRGEFLNRFAGRENIIEFLSLGIDVIERITTREIADLDRAYREQGISVTFEGDNLRNFCVDHYDPEVNARRLPGYIQANLEPIITDMLLLNSDLTGNLQVTYNTESKKFETLFQEKEGVEHGVSER